MLRIRSIMVGRTGRGPVSELVEDYLGRLRRMTTVEEVFVPEAGSGAPDFQRKREGERLLAVVKPGERVVALDERGRELGSAAFAAQLSAWRDQGVRDAAFIIGGAYGLDDAVRARADLILSLSAMTFPHQLVRAIFAEQLYRAFTIAKGMPYHH
jgi:23S rRNA (pseudouridine1915-N3)-methyltransferase